MYLIDKTYFANKYQIDNILESNSGVSSKLDAYIETYVIDFLQKLLGAVDFEDLDSNIENGALNSDAPQRWKDLINGQTYTSNGQTYVWKGLLYTNGSVKRSLLTNYVYCMILADLETNNGKIVLNAKNVITNVPRTHFVNVWNELAVEFQHCNDLYNFMPTYFIDGVPFKDYYNDKKGNGYVTLSEFLNYRKSDFEKTNLTFIEAVNRLNLG